MSEDLYVHRNMLIINQPFNCSEHATLCASKARMETYGNFLTILQNPYVITSNYWAVAKISLALRKKEETFPFNISLKSMYRGR